MGHNQEHDEAERSTPSERTMPLGKLAVNPGDSASSQTHERSPKIAWLTSHWRGLGKTALKTAAVGLISAGGLGYVGAGLMANGQTKHGYRTCREYLANTTIPLERQLQKLLPGGQEGFLQLDGGEVLYLFRDNKVSEVAPDTFRITQLSNGSYQPSYEVNLHRYDTGNPLSPTTARHIQTALIQASGGREHIPKGDLRDRFTVYSQDLQTTGPTGEPIGTCW